MPFQKGHKFGHRFTMDNQPIDKGRKVGAKNRSTIPKQILAMKGLYPDKVFQVLKERYPEIEKDTTIEEMLYIIQIDKAIKDQDTAAANFVISSAHGAPKAGLELNSNTVISIKIE